MCKCVSLSQPRLHHNCPAQSHSLGRAFFVYKTYTRHRNTTKGLRLQLTVVFRSYSVVSSSYLWFSLVKCKSGPNWCKIFEADAGTDRLGSKKHSDIGFIIISAECGYEILATKIEWRQNILHFCKLYSKNISALNSKHIASLHTT